MFKETRMNMLLNRVICIFIYSQKNLLFSLFYYQFQFFFSFFLIRKRRIQVKIESSKPNLTSQSSVSRSLGMTNIFPCRKSKRVYVHVLRWSLLRENRGHGFLRARRSTRRWILCRLVKLSYFYASCNESKRQFRSPWLRTFLPTRHARKTTLLILTRLVAGFDVPQVSKFLPGHSEECRDRFVVKLLGWISCLIFKIKFLPDGDPLFIRRISSDSTKLQRPLLLEAAMELSALQVSPNKLQNLELDGFELFQGGDVLMRVYLWQFLTFYCTIRKTKSVLCELN